MGTQPSRRPKALFAANSSYRFYNYHLNTFAAFFEAGYDVYLACPDDGYAAPLKSLGCRHVPLPLAPHSRNPFREFRTAHHLFRAYRRIRPDVTFHFTVKCNLYGAAAASVLGIPHANTVSGLGSAFATDGPLNRIIEWAYRLAQRRCARVFFQNPADLEFMQERGLVTLDQAVLLPGSGVNLERYASEIKPRGDRFVFVFAGRMLWEKGLAYLAEAMRRLRAEGEPVDCLVYGFIEPGNPKYVAREDVEGWEAEGVMRYPGPVDDVKPAYHEADCVILPTYYREGVPKSLLEAMAMAKPVLATDLPGCRQAVQDGENGFLCLPRDVESLTRAMRRMLRLSPEDLALMGARGRRLAEERFGEERVIAQYLRLADQLTGRDAGTPSSSTPA